MVSPEPAMQGSGGKYRFPITQCLIPEMFAVIPWQTLRAVMCAGAIALVAINAIAQTKEEPEPPKDPPPPRLAEALKDVALISQGEKLWQEQCTHCHGAKAYPGKAPRLQPRLYKPEFVWDRTHNGFRGMPPWKEVYKPDEIIALVAYVLSDDFFP